MHVLVIAILTHRKLVSVNSNSQQTTETLVFSGVGKAQGVEGGAGEGIRRVLFVSQQFFFLPHMGKLWLVHETW